MIIQVEPELVVKKNSVNTSEDEVVVKSEQVKNFKNANLFLGDDQGSANLEYNS